MDKSNSNGSGDMAGNAMDFINKLKDKYIVTILTIMIIGILIALVFFYYGVFNLENTTCKTYDEMYTAINPHIRSITEAENFKYMFRDYYIKTAANCCNTGNVKNGVVSTCALRNVIKDGVRGLDFEIYSMNDRPVVASSTLDKYTVKELYNKVDFEDVMGVIVNYAFSRGSCPNPDDPIIIHIRFMSQNQTMYETLASIFKQHEKRLLPSGFHYENRRQNLGEAPLLRLRKKIVVVVCNTNKTYLDVKPFYKYVNMTSGSMFMRYYTNDQIRNVPSAEEQVKYDKKNMSIVVPDRQSDPPNPGSVATRKMGIQLTAMQYYLNDTSLQEMREFFNRQNTAFVLKPENLRFVQKYIPAPKKQNPKLSFATKTGSAQGIKFNI
jgi:hypothetical protein|uniref:Phosphatidylinositol-specific phospholipase C X domain-containing protein n=1 Tax=viral metagenome TaxID=1070528 RepID=A0A6C0IL51_9ZZZZ